MDKLDTIKAPWRVLTWAQKVALVEKMQEDRKLVPRRKAMLKRSKKDPLSKLSKEERKAVLVELLLELETGRRD